MTNQPTTLWPAALHPTYAARVRELTESGATLAEAVAIVTAREAVVQRAREARK